MEYNAYNDGGSYPFPDVSSTSKHSSSDNSSLRSSGTLSGSDVHSWNSNGHQGKDMGHAKHRSFQKQDSLATPSDAEIERMFLELMV